MAIILALKDQVLARMSATTKKPENKGLLGGFYSNGCTRDGGGLKIGAGDDWLEILGSGMVNPRVLANCGYDPEKYQGFAFGMGIERIAMLKYGIPDLRTFYDSDLRWMRHYGFLPFDAPSVHAGLAGGSV